MKTKPQRYIDKLQAAGEEGVLEDDLMEDGEMGGNCRQIMRRMNKYLGKGAVYKQDGRWKLDRSYWAITPVEFRDMIIIQTLISLKRLILCVLPITGIVILLLGFLLGTTYEIQFLSP